MKDLIAPCGMDCSVCSGYLAFINKIPRKRGKITYCAGCRPRNKQCAFLKRECNKLRNNMIDFCYECSDYPCDNLKRIDNKYRAAYGMSFIENLEDIRIYGIDSFISSQQKKFGCERCGGKISVHSKKCFLCDSVNSWKD